jgi:hypothetical protein
MTIGERVNALVNATDDYAEIRLNTSDQFMEMMKFMFSEKYKLIESKEKEFQRMIEVIKSIGKQLNQNKDE